MDKETLNICIVGKMNSGKSTLTEAIINKQQNIVSWSDKSYEYESLNNYNCINDYPSVLGKRMLENLKKMDGMVLVISLSDFDISSFREYVFLANQFEIDNLVVFVNKCDLENSLEKKCYAEMEIRNVLEDCSLDFENIPVIYGSALKSLEESNYVNSDIDELVAIMDSWKERKSIKKIKKR